MSQSKQRLALLSFVGLLLAGCGTSAPPPKTTTDVVVQAETPSQSDAAGRIEAKDSKDKPVHSLISTAGESVVEFSEAAMLGDDVVALAVIHPRRITEWPVFHMLTEAGLISDRRMEELIPGLKFENIERATIVIDQSTVNKNAQSAGLNVQSEDPEFTLALQRAAAKGNLQAIGLGFHNYHDSNGRFPRADAGAEGQNKGLSWRVHLLPYLGPGGNELYQQFNLNEPWDSENNKALIEKMPDTYKSPGITEAGKTAFHVFSGPKTLFDGDRGRSLADIPDGTSNTIMALLGVAETADVWTKPGGLSPELANKVIGPERLVVMCDGYVHSLVKELDPQTMAWLIQPDDGQILKDFAGIDVIGGPPPPTAILTMTDTFDPNPIVETLMRIGEPVHESFEGFELKGNGREVTWFPDKRTAVIGSLESIKHRITTMKSGSPGAKELISQLHLGADASFAANIGSQSSLVDQAVENTPIPGIGLAQQVRWVSVQLSLTSKTDGPLAGLSLTFADENSAGAIAGMARGFLDAGKQKAKELAQPAQDDDDKDAVKLGLQIVDSAEIHHDRHKVSLIVPSPKEMARLPELLKPAFERAKASQQEVRHQNNLRQIGLAFHNYEAAYLKFPGAGGTEQTGKGLSWRVHLLPQLDQAELYQKFHLDEPWDSDHNKQLIEQMPDVFKVDGVTGAGKTSIHIFTGPGAPFENDQAPGFAAIKDGASLTILIVEAAAETAEVWTKPGGLNFDPKNPLKALGNLPENRMRVLMFDGSYHSLPLSIAPETLRKLIQSADGETIEDF